MTDVFKLIEANGLTLHGDIEHFAALVRADEREAILDLVDSYAKNNTDLADAIRARGETAPPKEIDPNQWAFDNGLEST